MVELSSQMGLYLTIMCILVGLSKTLRGKRGALYVAINLDDLRVLSVASLVLSLTQSFFSEFVITLISVGLAVYGFLIWLDALLFVQYRIEVNRQTLVWFFSGKKGLYKGLPHLLDGLNKYLLAAFVPLGWIALVVIAVNKGIVPFLPAVMVDWFVAITGLTALVALICVVGLNLFRSTFQPLHPFFTSPTLLLNIFSDDIFEASPDIEIKSEHRRFVEPNPKIPTSSQLYGELKGANIILVTVESLGAYVAPYTKRAAHSRIAERLKDNCWLSKQHFCLCPNTTVSTNQIYTGGYSNNPYNKDNSLYPGSSPKHIALLKQQGYKTLFLDSADTKLYDYHKLLSRIGFDKVWGTDDLVNHGSKADYRLLDMVDEVTEQVGQQPFFLHIINDQTHMPYQVIDKARFGRHGFDEPKSVYLNAVEEVDFILDTFLERLSKKLDLSNTILVFTGDHGESFGEYGYSFHSNSVIRPQMHVPFMMHHPKLLPKEIEHSCHFDLFPTFFDLLGITCPYPTLGHSLANDERDFAYFFHSATLKGNSPANFGFLEREGFHWVDRLFNNVSFFENYHFGRESVSKEKEYTKQLLIQMLAKRGMLV